MRPGTLFLHARSHALLVVAASVAALGAAFACSSRPNVHESDEAKGKPCFSCHSGAFTAAANPVHVNQMPQTCQDCHTTSAWSPSSVKDHYWFPLLNKHVDVKCVACHTKGFKLGDTPKDCLGCHRKDYDSSKSPAHVVKGVDQYPLDCTTCHTDSGFKPSPWKHDKWELKGGHTRPEACARCHSPTAGQPPKYLGTQKDCYECHKAEADTLGVAKSANHASFPHTCLDCHYRAMSGWMQPLPTGPLVGPHPEAKFPITTGKHNPPLDAGAPLMGESRAGIGCQDCHDLTLGNNAQGTDCIHCHVVTPGYPQGAHTSPAIDAYHLRPPDGGTVAGYPQGSSSPNFCLNSACHAMGQAR